MADITYRTADVDGLTVFYREAGASDAPTLVLLHGFPSASHMFRELIPQLAGRFHLVAPDLPGFGKSEMPARGDFDYTFEHIADVIDRLTEVLGLGRFALYVFDYGAPVGFRIATRHPERITAIISAARRACRTPARSTTFVPGCLLPVVPRACAARMSPESPGVSSVVRIVHPPGEDHPGSVISLNSPRDNDTRSARGPGSTVTRRRRPGQG
jgi:pimeloyl-ACP methyl ester carboxylesterase